MRFKSTTSQLFNRSATACRYNASRQRFSTILPVMIQIGGRKVKISTNEVKEFLSETISAEM